MNENKLIESLSRHEGCSLHAYRDTADVWTIGYGHNLQKATITQEQADTWLFQDMQAALLSAQKFPEYALLDTEARQNALVEMVFNMGAMRVSCFVAMLAAIRAQDWQQVYFEALNSAWANQVGRRANEIAEMFRTGEFPAE